MNTIKQISDVLASKYDMNTIKENAFKGVEYGKTVGENIANLLSFAKELHQSKYDNDVDPLKNQRDELLEILNNEEMNFGDKVNQIFENFKEDYPVKFASSKAIEVGYKIFD